MQDIDEMKFKQSIGKHIKIYRKDTQETLAEKAQISPDTLSMIERGENIASSLTLVKICNALNITPNQILEEFIKSEESSFDSIILYEITDFTLEEKEFLLGMIKLMKERNKGKVDKE